MSTTSIIASIYFLCCGDLFCVVASEKIMNPKNKDELLIYNL